MFHLRRLIGASFYTHLPTYEEGTECSETSAYKIQTPGNHPKESIQHKYLMKVCHLKNLMKVCYLKKFMKVCY